MSKAKFRKGQVVAARHYKGWIYGLVENIQPPAETEIDGKIKRDPLLYCVDFQDTPGGIPAHFDPWFKQGELRKPTRKEKGDA